MNFCSKCGTGLLPEARFCSFCGVKLIAPEAINEEMAETTSDIVADKAVVPKPANDTICRCYICSYPVAKSSRSEE